MVVNAVDCVELAVGIGSRSWLTEVEESWINVCVWNRGIGVGLGVTLPTTILVILYLKMENSAESLDMSIWRL